MTADDIISRAKAENRTALTEAESKQVLKHYGVPVVEEYIASDPDNAVRCSEKAGYPVALKGLGSKLTHKTERGLVRLNLTGPADVKNAASEIARAAGKDLEGYLVQPMVTGKRELVAGIFRDGQFGPVVMFGLGGIFTEALGDAVFRLAPLSDSDARSMMGNIRSGKILGPFRGEKSASLDHLSKTLTGISRLAIDHADVAEVDINPLIVRPDGSVVAVDALIVLGEASSGAKKRPPVDAWSIGNLFYPRSIAFIGASPTLGKWGHMLFTNLIAGGYKGGIYLVNTREKQIAGRTVYPTILDVPHDVDLAVVTVPARAVLDLIPQLREKGTKNMLLISSGFSEVGDEGRELESKLVDMARDAGILILGPNTMGICNPHLSLYCTGTHVRPKPGSTALIAQSGNLGTQLLVFAYEEGIGIRGFCGSGNEAMITIEDFIDGFEFDDLTKTIVLYVESLKNGRRFFEAARRVGKKKPIVLLKGGRTSEGNIAAASHTGAMASNMKVFEAACSQAGIVHADQPVDLLDLSACFSYLPMPKGNRVAIMTLGGGWGVVATDLCIESGLCVPTLSDPIIREIDKILPPFWSKANPVDLVGEFQPAVSTKVLEELVRWDGCDAIIHLGVLGRLSIYRQLAESIAIADPNYTAEFLKAVPQSAVDFENAITKDIVSLMEKYGKPIIGVSLTKDENTRIITGENEGDYRCISFLTPERAVKSLARMCSYGAWIKATKP